MTSLKDIIKSTMGNILRAIFQPTIADEESQQVSPVDEENTAQSQATLSEEGENKPQDSSHSNKKRKRVSSPAKSSKKPCSSKVFPRSLFTSSHITLVGRFI